MAYITQRFGVSLYPHNIIYFEWTHVVHIHVGIWNMYKHISIHSVLPVSFSPCFSHSNGQTWNLIDRNMENKININNNWPSIPAVQWWVLFGKYCWTVLSVRENGLIKYSQQKITKKEKKKTENWCLSTIACIFNKILIIKYLCIHYTCRTNVCMNPVWLHGEIVCHIRWWWYAMNFKQMTAVRQRTNKFCASLAISKNWCTNFRCKVAVNYHYICFWGWIRKIACLMSFQYLRVQICIQFERNMQLIILVRCEVRACVMRKCGP